MVMLLNLVKRARFKYTNNFIKKSYLYNGQSFWVTNKDKGMSKDIFVNHIREENAIKYFLKTLKHDDIVFDLGANMGYFVVQEALKCKQVIAVEPSEMNSVFLGLNIFSNKLNNVINHKLAIGNKNKIINFYISEAGNLSSVIERDKTHNYYKIEKIELIKGKDFIEKYDYKPTVLRMDIEGYEFEALKSFGNRLNNFNSIFLEVHKEYLKKNELKMFKLLKENGFNNFWYIPDEKKYGIYKKQNVTYNELINLNREKVYHLFCFNNKRWCELD